jgi:hypothetical protein
MKTKAAVKLARMVKEHRGGHAITCHCERAECLTCYNRARKRESRKRIASRKLAQKKSA